MLPKTASSLLPTSVLSLRSLSPTCVEISLQKPEGFSFLPGQYVEVFLPGQPASGWPFSLASAPEDPNVALCIRKAEDLLPLLQEASLGAELRLRGPQGTFRYETPPERHAVMLAAGTGIAPFRSMLRSQAFQTSPPRSLRLFLGVREPSEVLYADEPWSAIPRVSFAPVFSRSSTSSVFQSSPSAVGRLPVFLQQNPALASQADTDFYLCGPSDMITVCKEILFAHRVPPSALFHERW